MIVFAYGEGAQIVYAHRPYVVQMAVTNHTATARTVAKVTASCVCLKAGIATQTSETPISPGGALPIELMPNYIMPHDTNCCDYIMRRDIISGIKQSHAGIEIRKEGAG